MGLSVGTIRNHKHRLYYKLDITTERELFCMFFEQIIAGR
jgi:DNA-binding NarL/FixJ family response regulator